MLRKLVDCTALTVLLLVADAALASYGIYVGRNLTEDGSVFLNGTVQVIEGNLSVGTFFSFTVGSR